MYSTTTIYYIFDGMPCYVICCFAFFLKSVVISYTTGSEIGMQFAMDLCLMSSKAMDEMRRQGGITHAQCRRNIKMTLHCGGHAGGVLSSTRRTWKRHGTTRVPRDAGAQPLQPSILSSSLSSFHWHLEDGGQHEVYISAQLHALQRSPSHYYVMM